MKEPIFPEQLTADKDEWAKEYLVEPEVPEVLWVIPHHSPLDYCAVSIIRYHKDGIRAYVSGIRSAGFQPDNAFVKAHVRLDKLTEVPSWHTDFPQLYYDPCDPRNKDPYNVG